MKSAAQPQVGCPPRWRETTDAFKRWFAGSRVVDARGRPRIVYHGTPAEFRAFMPGDGNMLRGMYFTDDEYDAEQWARRAGATDVRVLAVYLSLQKPATDADIESLWPRLCKRLLRQPTPAEMTAALARAGFDGYMDESRYMEGMEFVAFRPEQIKSATANSGRFDPRSADIYDGRLKGFRP